MKGMLLKFVCLSLLLGSLTGTALAQGGSGGFAGVTVGTPGLLNANAGFYSGFLGFKGSLCFLNLVEFFDDEEDPTYDDKEEPWMFATQLNFDFILINKEFFLLSVGVVGGVFYAAEQYAEEDVFALYGGFAMGVIIGGFFVEAGVAWLSDYDANMFYYNSKWIPLVQVGYLYRL